MLILLILQRCVFNWVLFERNLLISCGCPTRCIIWGYMGDIRDNPKGFIHRMVFPTRHMLLVWYLASTWRQANWSKGKRLPIWLNPTAKLVSHVLPIYQKQLDLSNTEYPKMAMKQWGNRGKHDQLIMMIPPQVVTGPHIHQSHPHLSRDYTEVFSHFRNWTTMSRKFSTSNGWFDPSLTRAWKWIQGAKPSHVHQGSYETAYFGSQGYWAIPNCAFYDSDRAFPTTK